MGRNGRKQACRKEYGDRAEVLFVMGFMTYQEYLASALWTSIRRRVLARNSACVACGGPAVQVHHSRYTRPVMEGREMHHLYSVCDGCHRWSEYTGSGQKLSPLQATDKLLKAARRLKRTSPPATSNSRETANRQKRPDGASVLFQKKIRIEEQRRIDDRASADATLADYLERTKRASAFRKKRKRKRGA